MAREQEETQEPLYPLLCSPRDLEPPLLFQDSRNPLPPDLSGVGPLAPSQD